MHDAGTVNASCTVEPATLSAYGRGGLSPSASARLEAHIARCDHCRRWLEQSVESDPLIELLREASRGRPIRRPP